jgi:hypothetical protein
MNLDQLRDHLEQLDVHLSVTTDGYLDLSVPDAIELSDEVMDALRAHKPALVAIVVDAGADALGSSVRPKLGASEQREWPPEAPRRSLRDMPPLSAKGDRWLPWHFLDGEGQERPP